jgi:hypothetical protein
MPPLVCELHTIPPTIRTIGVDPPAPPWIPPLQCVNHPLGRDYGGGYYSGGYSGDRIGRECSGGYSARFRVIWPVEHDPGPDNRPDDNGFCS